MTLNYSTPQIEQVTTLTFDIFGTVLDLSGSLIPPLEDLLRKCKATSELTGEEVWSQWRYRQRIEQYQDNLLLLGHSGYLSVKKRSLIYTLRTLKVEFTLNLIDDFMNSYQFLSPFKEAVPSLTRLATKYKLVMLSNGEQEFLEYLADKRIKFKFDSILSAETVGQFKPHPSVYRFAAQAL